MNQMNSPFKAKPTGQPAGRAANPFARALSETEKSFGGPKNQSSDATSLFSDALSKTGGQLPDFDQNQMDPDALKKQQAEAEAKAKKERLRKKLHDQVNPVDMVDVFNAREKRVKEEIEKTRKELKALAQELSHFQQEIDMAVSQRVVSPGQQGTYYINFFHQLRQFIMLLRQKVKSARTWAKQMHKKKQKKGPRSGAGIKVGGNAAEQGKAVHDMMHHEQNTAYSGG